MANNPFFSIVIPTYNRANLILKTIESVFKQTFTDYEIIVVDNCSTDHTAAILDPLEKAGKIKFIRHDKNYERAVSRNTGMAAAKGKFLTLLDSDDLMYPDNLKDAYKFTQQNPDLNVFQNLYELIDERGKPIYQYSFPSLRNPVKAIANGNFLSCIGVFIAEEIFSKFRFDTSEVLQGIEDWEFWMRILAHHKIGRIKKINNGILHHKGRSISTYALNSYIQKKDYVLEKLMTDPGMIVYKSYRKSFNSSCYMLIASMANSAGLFNDAQVNLSSAFKIDWRVLFSVRYLRILLKSFLHSKNKIDNE